MDRPNRSFSISPEVFQQFPGYVRGVVLAAGIQNGPASAEVSELLKTAERQVQENLRLETLAEQPRIKAWREAYRAMGAKPTEFRPSIEALCRRVLNGHAIPSIHTLVDLGNIVSLRHLLPVGGHAIDVVTGDIQLRPAAGTEVFTTLGAAPTAPEHPETGEIVFVEEEVVLTRRWTWRQGTHTLMALDSQAVEFNVDGLPPVTPQEVEAVCSELAGLIAQFCGGRLRWEILSQENPVMSLEV